jgi:hypothetical protein
VQLLQLLNVAEDDVNDILVKKLTHAGPHRHQIAARQTNRTKTKKKKKKRGRHGGKWVVGQGKKRI